MVHAVFVPRINANDDELLLVAVHVAAGDKVTEGQTLAEVETSKAVVEVNAAGEGYVLRIDMNSGQNVPVGQAMMWIGESAADVAPPMASSSLPIDVPPIGGRRITAKARLLVRSLGLDEADIPSAGAELTTGDVEAFARGRQLRLSTPAAEQEDRAKDISAQTEDGQLVALTPWEKAMCESLAWQRKEAVPAYLEVALDVVAWERHAASAFEGRETMVSPLLGLIAHRAVRAVERFPRVNAVMLGEHYYFRQAVNLGFMVKAAKGLAMVCVADADRMDAHTFVATLSRLQRRAFGGRLKPEESKGATIAFTSLAKANVTRHIPVLPPRCSVIIAHSTTQGPAAVLGATYDHRVLDGDAAAQFLTFVADPTAQ